MAADAAIPPQTYFPCQRRGNMAQMRSRRRGVARRMVAALGVLLSVLLVVLLVGTVVLVRRTLPEVSGELQIGGVQSRVEIVRDKWGVPHIYAQNPHDLIFAQGYVQAQDRLWQMELYRRT